MVVAKKIAVAAGFDNYNILQVQDCPHPLCHFLFTILLGLLEQREDSPPGESRKMFNSCERLLINNPRSFLTSTSTSSLNLKNPMKAV